MFKVVVFFLTFILYLSLVSSLSANQDVIIKIRESGFEPRSVVLNKGQSLIFMNEGLNDHWPASNIHPTHGIYPEFDPKKEILPGQSWRFKFDKAGVFRFHDHLVPGLSGDVTVLGESTKTPRERNLTINSLLKKASYLLFPESLENDLAGLDSLKAATDEAKLEYWVNLVGGKRYMQELVKDSKGGSSIDCHQEAHLTGRKSFAIEGKEVFRDPDYNCHSGFLHGSLEAFITSLNGKDLIKEVEKLCLSFPTDFGVFECFHGIGHGLTAYVDYDLPQAFLECQKILIKNDQTSCYGGVFMENIMVAEGRGAVPGHKSAWVSNDPHFPCNNIDKDYDIQFHCYQMQTSRMLQLKPGDYEFLEQECVKSPENMVDVCFTSMGRDIAGQTLRDPQKITEYCRIVPEKYFQDCIKGALNVIIDFWGENIVDQPQKLCFVLEKKDKNFCYELLGNRLKGIFPGSTQVNLQEFIFPTEPYGILFNVARTLISFGSQTLKIRQICSQFEDEYVNLCLNGST